MKTKVIVLLLSLILSFAKQGHAQLTKLNTAYEAHSANLLKLFLDEWATEVKPITANELEKMPLLHRKAYEAFEVFYDPHSLQTKGSSRATDELYRNYNYFIVQNELKVFTADKVYYTDEEVRKFVVDNLNKNKGNEELTKKTIRDFMNSGLDGSILVDILGPYGTEAKDSTKRLNTSIHHFRPRMLQAPATPLYLNSKYKEILKKFLGDEHVGFADPGPSFNARAKGSSADKQKFLNNLIKVNYGHWGGYWAFLTPPSVSAITFDSQVEYAKVDYRLIYEGGFAYLKFENGKWKLISAKRTWRQ